jgi:hypothetical protein
LLVNNLNFTQLADTDGPGTGSATLSVPTKKQSTGLVYCTHTSQQVARFKETLTMEICQLIGSNLEGTVTISIPQSNSVQTDLIISSSTLATAVVMSCFRPTHRSFVTLSYKLKNMYYKAK